MMTMSLWRLDDLARLRMSVQLHVAHRQAMRVGIVLLVCGHALLAQLPRPRPKRQSAFDVAADIEKRGERRRSGRRLRRLRRQAFRRIVPGRGRRALRRSRLRHDRVEVDLPEAAQIRMPVRCARRWAVEIGRAVSFARNVRRGVRGPLRGSRSREQSGQCGHDDGCEQGVHPALYFSSTLRAEKIP